MELRSNKHSAAEPARTGTTLLLTPTRLERERVLGSSEWEREQIHICGFGPVAPAATTMRLIHAARPDRIVLFGIAGSYAEHLKVGSAYCFDSVACYGVGVGSGSEFKSAGQLGWQHFQSEPEDGQETQAAIAIGDELPLKMPLGRPAGPLGATSIAGQLLTVCAAAANEHEVRDRRQLYPRAEAEDMEAFAVAVACALSQVELVVVRGISNVAGNRNHSQWKIDDALAAVVELVDRVNLPITDEPANA